MPFHKCRLCLKIGDFCSIFEKDDAVKLSEMVMSFANIKILEGDGLSDRVCTSCIENLSTAYLFKQQCERIDSLLRKYPDIQLDKAPTSDYNELYNMEFHMHSENESVQGENDKNLIKDNSQDSDFFHSIIKDKSQDSDHFHSIIKDNSQDSDYFHSIIKDNSQDSDYFHSIIKDKSQDSDHFHSIIKDNSQDSDYFHSISDTDSDIDSVKCVYCNQSYNNCERHTCHVTCTIEHNEMQRSSSNETLVAADQQHIIPSHKPIAPVMNIPEYVQVSCVLCEEKYDEYDAYVTHLNKCTTNVKVQHYVCPLCHEIFTEKLDYLKHLKINHFKVEDTVIDMGFDCVDFAPSFEKTRRPKAVRRQIGWSIEDIYQEIECTKIEENQTPTSSPLKKFFSKLGNESFSRQSTPKKVSFRKFIENGKAKTAVYLPFRKYIQNYKMKKKTNEYSPINSKTQIVSKIQATLPEVISDSDYNSPSGTSEESWKMKQNLICACDKKVFMLSEFIHDRDRIVAMINELGGVVSENTKMEMLATHFISVLPNDTFSGMMVCALATGKWLLHISFIYDSFRCKKFLQESMYEWMKHPKIVEIDTTSLEVAKAAVYWHLELQTKNAKFPFEGKQIVLIMKKKYRQYYQMVFKALKAKPVTYDPRTPGSCCTADYCFVDMKIIERVKLRFFFHHNVPVFPYQYILVYLLKRGHVENEHKYLLQECNKIKDTTYYMNNTY